MSAPRFERKQVVHNLTVAFAGVLRSYRLGLPEMFYRPAEVDAIIREAVAAALKEAGL